MSKKQFNKKEQFTKPQKNKLPAVIAISTVVIVVIAFTILMNFNKQQDKVYFGDVVTSPRSYVGRFISMTPVQPIIENGEVRINFNEVDQNNIVFFEVENNENIKVPLMAYITPSGRLFTGSSMCEPCKGRTFSLAGETLVCDTCKTTYDIEDHTFLSGSVVCGSYPPVYMNSHIKDGMIVINLEEILNWRSRW